MIVLLALLVSLVSNTAHSAERGARFQNLDQMMEELNLRPYFQRGLAPKRALRVAIFDNGFKGAKEEIGRSLPSTTRLVPGPVALQGEEEVHGFYMARIVWSLLSLDGEDERYRPAEFLLYNTFGYSNFKAAIDDAIARKVDIVLYSQTWDYGGNFDGRGFINQLVNKALRAGILWINSSGNTGSTTFNGAIKTGAEDWLELPGRNDSVEIRCDENPLGKCPLRAVLSWNDFSDDVNEGTDKDLDFVLTDDTLNIIQGSSLRQVKKVQEGEPGVSQYPREIITAELKPGVYFLRVKNRSKNFTSRDRLRLSVQGDSLRMRNRDLEESVLPPADNPGVLAVGALDTERSSRSRLLRKPDLYSNSLVVLNREESFKGTSNSAAKVAAGAAILMSLNDNVNRRTLMERAVRRENESVSGRGLPLESLGFGPTGPGCFRLLPEASLPEFVRYAVSLGGRLVDTNLGAKVFFPFDPLRVLPSVRRQAANDILVMTAEGPGVYQRSGVQNLPTGMIELAELPLRQRICSGGSGTKSPSSGKVFRLP